MSSRLTPRNSTLLSFLPLEDRVVPATQVIPANYVAVGSNAGQAPVITVINTDTDQVALTFEAYDKTVTTGVQVDLGDVTGDGVLDIVTSPGVGGGPHVRVFDGLTGEQLQTALGNFFAGDPAARQGAHVETWDANDDGIDDLFAVVPTDAGVAYKLFDGATGKEAPIAAGRFSSPEGEMLAIRSTGGNAGSQNQICIRDPFPTKQPIWSGGVREMTEAELVDANQNYAAEKSGSLTDAEIEAHRNRLKLLIDDLPPAPGNDGLKMLSGRQVESLTRVGPDGRITVVYFDPQTYRVQRYDTKRNLWIDSEELTQAEQRRFREILEAKYRANPFLRMEDPRYRQLIHDSLDAAGLIPGAGEVADGVNALIYLAEGDTANAMISMAGMIPIAGMGVVGVRIIRNTARTANGLIALRVIHSSCFAAGTPLLTSSGGKLIENFRPGDRLLSRSEFDENGVVEEKLVEEVFQRLAEVVEVIVQGRVIRTTAEHPFWVADRGWVPTRELEPGMKLLSHQGEAINVQAVNVTGTWATVYNLRVAEHHTYFVGDDDWGFSVWAHNQYLAQQLVGHNGVAWGVVDARTGKVIETSPGVPKVFTQAEAYREAQERTRSLVDSGRHFIKTNPSSVHKPQVTDGNLKILIDQIYKGLSSRNPIGTGSTADAVRFEKMTGMTVEGVSHIDAARQRINAIKNWLRDNPHASQADKSAANAVMNDLIDALR